MVLALSANRTGLSVIEYSVDVWRGTSSHNLFPLEIVVRGGIALVRGVLAIALADACKRETVR